MDLDDTIFRTKSMDPLIFEPAISWLKKRFMELYPKADVTAFERDLWTFPVDVISKKYQLNPSLVSDFFNRMAKLDLSGLKIQPYEDYRFLKEITLSKILVTTGLKELQMAKINALHIKDDFGEIKIDDPRTYPRKHKMEIFKQILVETQFPAECCWVIGDNPDSEIEAGVQLGMKTIQRRAAGKQISPKTDFIIDSFKELKTILNT